MKPQEYIAVHRAYNLVRQETDSSSRLVFEEMAILCKLSSTDRALGVSEIAQYQNSLMPTMTHRLKHLGGLGYIKRAKGQIDRRNILCELTPEGQGALDAILNDTYSQLGTGQALTRIPAKRLAHYINAMGTVYLTSGELVLLALRSLGSAPTSVSTLVKLLGLMQPTASMSVSALCQKGLARRVRNAEADSRLSLVTLTDEGQKRANQIAQAVMALKVCRPRKSAE